GTADTQMRRSSGQRDRLIPLANGRLDALDVARDARRVAGGGRDDLDGVLAARSLSPLGLDLVEPGRRGFLFEEASMNAGQDGHGGILTGRSRGAGEALREGAGDVDDG